MTALSKPLATMAEEKKSYMKKFKQGIQALFHKGAKRSAENETEAPPKTQAKPPVKVTPLLTLLENYEKLKLENESKKKEETTIDDELKNFNIKTVENKAEKSAKTVKNEARNVSVSSNDSGVSDKDDSVAAKSEIDETGDLVESLNKLRIAKKKGKTTIDDELKNFNIITVENKAEKSAKTVKNEARNVSVSSNGSGFSDKDDSVAAKSEIDESLKKLEIAKKKGKKLQTVYISRGPVRNNFDRNAVSHPYNHQINRTFLSGGTVILNDTYDTFNENPEDDPQQVAEKLIVEKCFDNKDLNNVLQMIEATEDITFDEAGLQNIPLSSNAKTCSEDILCDFKIPKGFAESYPTPPMSNENVFSPQSLSPNASFYPSPPYQNVCFPNPLPLSSYIHQGFGEEFNNTEISPLSNYSLSSDGFQKTDDEEQIALETFEESDIPSCVFDTTEEAREDEAATPRPRERIRSSSSVTMKQYKDMQNELSSEFAKRDCCLEIPKDSSRDFFRDHFIQLNAEERKNLCLQVAKLELKTVGFGVLHNVMINVSTSAGSQGLLFALFGLICERVLAEEPELFLKDFGLSLLKASALRCPTQPMLTRHVSRCVRIALQQATRDAKEPLFKETDSRGDNLLGACARRGDACADVLAELVRRDDVTQPPLFDVAHVNAEGHSALHVACLSHVCTSVSCLHVVHVLLAHAHADLYQGDIKGGDTALHLAVNSVSCDLRLVMTLFKHVDRKLWKKLAHTHNRSSVTPLEYARSATKASTRKNYPQEVLNFLKKCR